MRSVGNRQKVGIKYYKNLYYFVSKIIEVTDETHALLKVVAAKKGIYIKDWVRNHAQEDAKKLGLV